MTVELAENPKFREGEAFTLIVDRIELMACKERLDACRTFAAEAVRRGWEVVTHSSADYLEPIKMQFLPPPR